MWTYQEKEKTGCMKAQLDMCTYIYLHVHSTDVQSEKVITTEKRGLPILLSQSLREITFILNRPYYQ